MKLEPELVREILLFLEEQKTVSSLSTASDFDLHGWDEDQITYNLLLLLDADYIVGKTYRAGNDKVGILVERMSWDGHAFLDAARDDKRWTQAKTAAVKIGGVSLEILKSLLIELARQAGLKALGLAP